MDKNEKLEEIYHLAQEAGLSSEEVAEYFSARKHFSAPKVYETPAEIFPGMFVYTDGLIYPTVISGRQIKAIVAHVEDRTVLAACLKRMKLPWSSDGLRVEVTADLTDGKEATRKILEVVRKSKKQAEAAQWCHDYAESGVQPGEAFLPSMQELIKLNMRSDLINGAFATLRLPLLWGRFLSSNENDVAHAKSFNINSECSGRLEKSYYAYVLPMLKIQL